MAANIGFVVFVEVTKWLLSEISENFFLYRKNGFVHLRFKSWKPRIGAHAPLKCRGHLYETNIGFKKSLRKVPGAMYVDMDTVVSGMAQVQH